MVFLYGTTFRLDLSSLNDDRPSFLCSVLFCCLASTKLFCSAIIELNSSCTAHLRRWLTSSSKFFSLLDAVSFFGLLAYLDDWLVSHILMFPSESATFLCPE